MITARIAEHFGALRTAVDGIGSATTQISDWGGHLAAVLARGGRLLACGNGASAANAQHLTAELVGRFHDERIPLSAIALHTDVAALTATVDNYGEDEMFARGVRAHGRPGDVLVVLSSGGASRTLLSAVTAAADSDITTWALTGPAPNPLASMCEDAVCVDAADSATVREVHLLLVHALCMAVDHSLLYPDLPVNSGRL